MQAGGEGSKSSFASQELSLITHHLYNRLPQPCLFLYQQSHLLADHGSQPNIQALWICSHLEDQLFMGENTVTSQPSVVTHTLTSNGKLQKTTSSSSWEKIISQLPFSLTKTGKRLRLRVVFDGTQKFVTTLNHVIDEDKESISAGKRHLP